MPASPDNFVPYEHFENRLSGNFHSLQIIVDILRTCFLTTATVRVSFHNVNESGLCPVERGKL